MTPDDATFAQVEAADPGASTWLSANAGSGKTRVLTDRVARLLLRDVPPERILCLTYTKAAASEMQNRLFKRLGAWAMTPEVDLRTALAGLGVPVAEIDVALIARARTLFARAIETPGGLKIQTIHSFCSAVLRRFPLEAGVSPRFAEMDERSQAILCADVLDDLAGGPQVGAMDALAEYLSGDDAMPFLKALLAKRTEIGAGVPEREVFDWFGVPAGETDETIVADVFHGGEVDLCQSIIPYLDPENRTQGPHIARFEALRKDAPGLADLELLEAAFLVGSSAKNAPDSARIGNFPNKAIWGKMGHFTPDFEALMERVEAARPRRRALLAARKTAALHRFAAAFLPAFERAKAAHGWLDFDDLIHRARALLSDSSVAQWVLFRLDGGIDHILVDEAQDTAPAQWEIIAQLAGEFAAGKGARDDTERTIFVVGDKKQSIYSFQGADPDGFDRMRVHFKEGLEEVGARFQTCALLHSFRSAVPILGLVDRVFADVSGAGVGRDVTHIAHKQTLPGRVDIWPPVAETKKTEPPEWDDPVDRLADDHHTVILADRVARAIQTMLSDGTTIEDEGQCRPVKAGDILILVQRRSELFHELIAAIKACGLPIAGADRMRLAAELAVKDLTALLAFLATPEDDLSLAAILRSPLFGWSEGALHDLAYGRKGFLWRALQDRAAEFGDTVDMLVDLRDRADYLRPYDLLERVLIRHDGRRRLLARLGQEAEDGIDAMLAQALAYERMDVPSLTGFVGWLQADDVQIKRDPGSAGNQIRVMSVHGAKGLEAPVVILPDTAYRQGGHPGPVLMVPEDGPVIWAGAKDDAPAVLRPLFEMRAAREAEERNRLLYVAMTRAESWLIACATGKLETRENGSWFTHIRDAAAAMGAAEQTFFDEPGLRIETGDWSGGGAALQEVATPGPLPDWVAMPPKSPARAATTLSPSDLGGAKSLPGDGLEEEAAKARGRRLHLLLEHLPEIAPAAWAAAAPGILATEGDLEEPERAALFEEATACLTAPQLADVFADDALAEVSLTADSAVLGQKLMGQIDRLILSDGRILAVDFKSNAMVPARTEDTPEGLLRQMGAYAEMLAAIYPGQAIETAILWTRAARLMPLPDDLVMAALHRARGA